VHILLKLLTSRSLFYGVSLAKYSVIIEATLTDLQRHFTCLKFP